MSDNGRRDRTLPPFTSNESTTSSKSSKSSILRKKLQAEKLALELKIAERECEDEIKLLRAEAQQRAKLLELKKKAEGSRLEYQYEDAIAREERLSNNGDLNDIKELSELPIDSLHDRVSRLELNSAPNTQNITGDKQPDEQGKRVNSGGAAEEEIKPSKRETSESCGKREPAWWENRATGNPSVSNLDQLFEKMLPAFVKIVKPNIMKFSGNPLEYSKFKAAFKVEVDKRGVYDETEKLKFLLDAVEGGAKTCLAKFMPGSGKYEEA